jgi:glycine hydroxymethyltransferase
VVKNARAMAEEFVSRGYDIVSGGTDNHLMLLDLRRKGVTGKLADHALGEADITVNKNMIPFDPESPMITSGIRVGTAAVTTRGFKEEHCRQVAAWMDEVISQPNDAALQARIRAAVNQFMKQFPLYH